MSYRDVPAAEAERLKSLSKAERDLERVKLDEETDKYARYDKPTDAQNERWGELLDSLEYLQRLDQHDAIREAAKDPRRVIAPKDLDDSGRTRDSAMFAVDALVRSGDLADYSAERVEALVSKGMPTERSLASRWAASTADPHYTEAFLKLCADPTRGHLLWTPQEQEAFRTVAAVQSEMRAMGLTDSAGGYMVPLTLDPSVIITGAGSINPLRQISRVVQTVTDQWQGVSSAGVTAEWKAEAAEAADASPTIDDEPIPVHFGDAYVPFSFEIGMDSRNFLQELSKLLTDAADQLMATAYTTGTGSGQPTGIITALAGTASEINVSSSETFTAADVFAIQEALPPRFQANAKWCANVSVLNDIQQFETAAGAKVFPEVSGTPPLLLRKPLNENSNMDGAWNVAATANNYILLYGDFSNFVIVDRIGTTLELIPHVVGTNRRPTGQRGALLWFRTGSDSVNDNAFRMLDLPTTA